MQLDVIVYYITGKQIGPLSVPTSWCEECDLTVRAVQNALAQVDPESKLTFEARPWLPNAIPALLKGGWHPPVVLIRGEIFCQGAVPEAVALRSRLAEVLSMEVPT